jgi:D-beta-D-heptose 7-phosphate kinase/D-beta-D-heptose 1-phosphate adenosyltransferase
MNITIIGEYCKDIFIYGDAKRLSPEAPVPVFTPTNVVENLGMAGNVFENVRALSLDGNYTLLSQNQSIKKIRYVDDKSNHMFLRVDEGEEFIDKIELTEERLEKIRNSDIVIISDYNKGFLDIDSLITIGKLSKLSILDTKKILNEDVMNSYDFIKLNKEEYKRNKELCDKFPHKFIITMGMEGAVYNGDKFSSPAPTQTMDVSGAGDTFTASFILKYNETKNIDESIIYANKMASIVVSKRGVATP